MIEFVERGYIIINVDEFSVSNSTSQNKALSSKRKNIVVKKKKFEVVGTVYACISISREAVIEYVGLTQAPGSRRRFEIISNSSNLRCQTLHCCLTRLAGTKAKPH